MILSKKFELIRYGNEKSNNSKKISYKIILIKEEL